MLSYCLDIAQLPFQLSEVLMKRFIPRSGFNLQQPWGKVLKKEREREKEIKKERKRERERRVGGGCSTQGLNLLPFQIHFWPKWYPFNYLQ